MATQAELELVFRLRDQVTQNLGRIQTALRSIGSTIQQVNRSFGSAGGFLGGVGAASAVGGIAAIGFAFDSTEEQARIAFETIFGSAARANDMIERVKKTAQETPFGFTDLLRASQRLAAADFGEDEIQSKLMTISDAISSTGDISRDKLDQITLAVARAKSAGVFDMGMIESFSAAGINVVGALAKQEGIPEFAESKRLQALSGRVAAGPMIDQIFRALSAKFGGLSARESSSMQGVINNLKDILEQIFGAMLLPFFNRTEKILERVFYYLQQVRDQFKKLPEPVKDVVKTLGALVVTAPGVLLVLGLFATAINNLILLFNTLKVGAAIALVLDLLMPFAVPLALIALAVVALYLAWQNNWLGIRDITERVVDNLRSMFDGFRTWLSTFLDDPIGHVWDVLVYAVNGWLQLFGMSTGQIGDALRAGWQYVVSLAQWLGSTVWSVLLFAADGWLKVFGTNTTEVGDALRAGWEYVVSLFQWLVDTTSGILAGGWTYVAQAFQWLAVTAGDAIRWGWDNVVAAFVWLKDTVIDLIVRAWTAVATLFTWLRDTGAGAVQWLVDRVVQLFSWMGEQVARIWNPIRGIIGAVGGAVGGVVTIIGNNLPSLSGQSSLVAAGVGGSSGGGGGGSNYTVNITGPVYAPDIEDVIVRALDQITRRGRSG